VSRHLAEQRDFLASHRQEIDEAAIETLWASQQKAIRLAKIRRARILETIEANKRSLGVLHAYQVATTL
jgi:hypothetical protein